MGLTKPKYIGGNIYFRDNNFVKKKKKIVRVFKSLKKKKNRFEISTNSTFIVDASLRITPLVAG